MRKKQLPEYMAWRHMIRRCEYPTSKDFRLYGARGIKVCERWHSFDNFLADVGKRPGVGYSLDRYPNNNGNYEPGNVRWATPGAQARNRRTNRLLTLDGRTMTVAEWSDEFGISRFTVRDRLNRGLGVREALTAPRRGRSGDDAGFLITNEPE